jgi:hypothetical protein
MRFSNIRRSAIAIFTILIFVGGGSAAANAQEGTPVGAPLDLPCTTGVTVEMLGQALPADANGKALVAARLTIAPDGGFDAHTHPGTVTVFVDSGSLGFTMLDHGDMTINRADGTTEPAVMNQEILVNQGDGFVEQGMTHQAWNRSDGPTVVILSGFVDPSQPLVICAQ